MSSKINISEIVRGHAQTMRAHEKVSKLDMVTFFAVPLIPAILVLFLGTNIDKDLTALLVNFGSIFTALLLSVLVLVYDQEAKVDALKTTKLISDECYSLKKQLLEDLYYNIAYSIVIALSLVLICFIHSVGGNKTFNFDDGSGFKIGQYITSPLALYITANLFLTIIMIVKRMHVLLTTKN